MRFNRKLLDDEIRVSRTLRNLSTCLLAGKDGPHLIQDFLDRDFLEDRLRFPQIHCLLNGLCGDDDLAGIIVVDLDLRRCHLLD